MLVYSSLFVQNLSESTPGPDEEYNVSTTPGAPLEETTNRLAARVEPYDKGDREQYDVIDVATATGTVMGKPRSGQTTRIYTTGEVDESFWLKHLGDDFKHAIHLQVGGTKSRGPQSKWQPTAVGLYYSCWSQHRPLFTLRWVHYIHSVYTINK